MIRCAQNSQFRLPKGQTSPYRTPSLLFGSRQLFQSPQKRATYGQRQGQLRSDYSRVAQPSGVEAGAAAWGIDPVG